MADMNIISKARSRLLVRHVFFATLVLNTPLYVDNAAGTAFTDYQSITVSETFLQTVGKSDTDFAMFVLAHEVGHIIFMHNLRMGNRDPDRWNIACDHAINLWLKECGFTLWDKCYQDQQYKGMTAEQIYEKLPKKSVKCDGGFGRDLRPKPVSEEQANRIERQVRGVVAQAVNIARAAGKLSANIERMVSGIINPPQPWEDLLRHYATRVVHDEETWARRNRRILGTYLPSRYNVTMGELVIVTDTSGSIGDDFLAQVGAEATYIRDTIRPERTRVVYVDADIRGEQIFEGNDDIVLRPRGGGGTDMCVGLAHVAQFEPACVILATDGHTPWPDAEPEFPLIVACSTNVPVPIGDVVRMYPK